MKKKMYQSVVATHFREHSSIYLFVVVLFLMGVIFGAIVVNSLTFSQKEDLAYYLSQFFGEVSNGKVAASKDVFAQSLFDNSKFIGMMGILGISIIGLPVILIVLFMKGLVIGFTVGFGSIKSVSAMSFGTTKWISLSSPVNSDKIPVRRCT